MQSVYILKILMVLFRTFYGIWPGSQLPGLLPQYPRDFVFKCTLFAISTFFFVGALRFRKLNKILTYHNKT